MSYNPVTDFLSLVRMSASGAREGEMPGLDYTVLALSRAGLIALVVGPNAPTSNQSSTAWFKPAQPSWSAEGQLFLWNAGVGVYQPATPALWAALFAPAVAGYVFQEITGAGGIVQAGTSLCAVVRSAPSNTTVTLPTIAAQQASGRKLQIFDFSTGVTLHDIQLVTPDGSTIMQRAQWDIVSTAVQLAGIQLQPCPDLNTWVIAP
jgi:hypothetical protein